MAVLKDVVEGGFTVEVCEDHFGRGKLTGALREKKGGGRMSRCVSKDSTRRNIPFPICVCVSMMSLLPLGRKPRHAGLGKLMCVDERR